MNIFQIAVCLVFAGTHTSVVGTLSHAKSVTDQQTTRLNNIAKLIKKDKEVEVIITPPPPVTSTTVKLNWANKNDPNGNNFDPVESNTRTHKAVELGIVIGGVTTLLIVLALAVRTCYYIYNKVKTLASPPQVSVAYRSSPHPHPSHPSTQAIGPGGQSIFTVMPGHFVLQPCFTSRTAPSVVGTVEGSSQHQPMPFPHGSSTRSRDDGACVVTVVRPETPPPPYPGTGK